MKIAVVIASLKGGGAERITVDLANWWSRAHEVHLVTFDDETDETLYELSADVTRHRVGNPRPAGSLIGKIVNNISRITKLKKTLDAAAPDCIVSMIDQTNVLALIAGRLARIPVIVSEHTDIRCYSPGAAWRLLRAVTYPLAARVVSVTRNTVDSLPWYIRKQAVTIYNPVHQPEAGRPDDPARRTAGCTVIAAGRLVPLKGFDMLIDAFASIAPANHLWNLEIWGEGECRTALEQLIDSLGMRGRVFLRGHTRQLSDQFLRADIFVLSSRFEGFPMALCEAMACGLPAVAFDCPSGPSEIITPGVNGILVPPGDIPALAAAIGTLINDEPLRKQWGKNAADSVQKFSIERIGAAWDGLFRGAGL